MNKKLIAFKKNRLIQKIRFSNRSGLHLNCIRIFKNNSKEHERVKFEICLELIRRGFDIFTEAIFTSKSRADILAISPEGDGYIYEIETSKSEKEMELKINEKNKYPKEFKLIIIESKGFDINKI